MKFATMLLICLAFVLAAITPCSVQATDGGGVVLQSYAPAVVLQSVHAQPQVFVQQVQPVRVQRVVVQQVPQHVQRVQQVVVQQVPQHVQRVQQVVVQQVPQHVQRVQQVVVQQQHPVVVQQLRNQALVTRQVTVTRPQRSRIFGR